MAVFSRKKKTYRIPRLSSFTLEDYENPAEDIAEIWFNGDHEPQDGEVSAFEFANDIAELSVIYDNLYAYHLYESVFFELNDIEVEEVIQRFKGRCTNKTREIVSDLEYYLKHGERPGI